MGDEGPHVLSWLGVMPDGKLGVGKFDEGRVSLETSNFVVAWPLLERDFRDVYMQLSESWGELEGNSIETPEKLMECILSSAWASGRKYWMQLCLPWALRMGQADGFDANLLRAVLSSMSRSEAIWPDGRESAKRVLEILDVPE
jgi:hypothetical protein